MNVVFSVIIIIIITFFIVSSFLDTIPWSFLFCTNCLIYTMTCPLWVLPLFHTFFCGNVWSLCVCYFHMFQSSAILAIVDISLQNEQPSCPHFSFLIGSESQFSIRCKIFYVTATNKNLQFWTYCVTFYLLQSSNMVGIIADTVLVMHSTPCQGEQTYVIVVSLMMLHHRMVETSVI